MNLLTWIFYKCSNFIFLYDNEWQSNWSNAFPVSKTSQIQCISFFFFKSIGLSLAWSNERRLKSSAHQMSNYWFLISKPRICNDLQVFSKEQEKSYNTGPNWLWLYSYFFFEQFIDTSSAMAIREISLSQCRFHVCELVQVRDFIACPDVFGTFWKFSIADLNLTQSLKC